MKIALVHFRAGETDGVSLEMAKWKRVLEKMGHDVFYISGDLYEVGGVQISTISMRNQVNLWIHRNAFEKLSVDEKFFIRIFQKYVQQIRSELEAKAPPADIFIVNNIFSLGFNLAAAVAIDQYVRENKVKVIGHHHDFYWERERYSNSQMGFVEKILDDYFPPKNSNMMHVTINNIARNELISRKGVNSFVIPNVFDFDQPQWVIDDYNRDLRGKLGISDKDFVLLHATRIVERKAIEIAMDFAEYLQKFVKKEVHFVVGGFPEKESLGYFQKLQKKADNIKVKTHFAYPLLRQNRSNREEKFYSFWDIYAISDAITYTSVLEGWGNQLIEAVFARKPLIVFEYPVYKTDIKPLGFDFISLSDAVVWNEKTGFYEIDKNILQKAAKKLAGLIGKTEELEKKVKQNFDIGKKYLSLESLEKRLDELMKNL